MFSIGLIFLLGSPLFSQVGIINGERIKDHDSLWFRGYQFPSFRIKILESKEDRFFYDSLCMIRGHVASCATSERLNDFFPVSKANDYPDVSYELRFTGIRREFYMCHRCESIRKFIIASKVDSFPVWRK